MNEVGFPVKTSGKLRLETDSSFQKLTFLGKAFISPFPRMVEIACSQIVGPHPQHGLPVPAVPRG